MDPYTIHKKTGQKLQLLFMYVAACEEKTREKKKKKRTKTQKLKRSKYQPKHTLTSQLKLSKYFHILLKLRADPQWVSMETRKQLPRIQNTSNPSSGSTHPLFKSVS